MSEDMDRKQMLELLKQIAATLTRIETLLDQRDFSLPSGVIKSTR